MILTSRERVRLKPQFTGGVGRINPRSLPPRSFIAATVNLAMVPATQRHGELIADLAAQRTALRKAQVVGVAGLTATDQAGLLSDEADMIAIADAPRFGVSKDRFVD